MEESSKPTRNTEIDIDEIPSERFLSSKLDFYKPTKREQERIVGKLRNLYLFTSLDSFKKILKSKALKVSRTSHTNDPTENLYAGETDLDEEAIEYGYICLSADIRSPMMWGDYADRGKGVCLVFSAMYDDRNCCGDNYLTVLCYLDRFTGKYHDIKGEHIDIFPVMYQKKRLERGKTNFFDLITTKHISWRYEKEFRFIVHLTETDSVMNDDPNYPFETVYLCNKLMPMLSQVVLGVNCNNTDIIDVENNLLNAFCQNGEYYMYPIRVSKATIAAEHFQIEPNFDKMKDTLLRHQQLADNEFI